MRLLRHGSSTNTSIDNTANKVNTLARNLKTNSLNRAPTHRTNTLKARTHMVHLASTVNPDNSSTVLPTPMRRPKATAASWAL